jgi:hypothetical protein
MSFDPLIRETTGQEIGAKWPQTFCMVVFCLGMNTRKEILTKLTQRLQIKVQSYLAG